MTKTLVCVKDFCIKDKMFIAGKSYQLDIAKRLDGTIAFVLNNRGWYNVSKRLIDNNFI